MAQIFWLHIKKSGGQSARKALQPHYVEVDRIRRPKTFVQSDRTEWNDILNNYRVPLGDYQFRRSLFAKRYLYKEDFSSLFKFAFVRNPLDRCLSQFFYLWRRSDPRKIGFWAGRARLLQAVVKSPTRLPSTRYDFDLFLEAIETCRASSSNYYPGSLHFQTHTAPMWDDITDEGGACLMDRIWRLEKFDEAIAHVHSYMGTPELVHHPREYRENKTTRAEFEPSRSQRTKIEALFGKDFDLYDTNL